jgi:hypothetical protein
MRNNVTRAKYIQEAGPSVRHSGQEAAGLNKEGSDE